MAMLLPGLPGEESELTDTSTGVGAESSIIITACRRFAPTPDPKASSVVAEATDAVAANLCVSEDGVLGKATRDFEVLGNW